MDPPLIRGGAWWRAWTALTLHADATHLLGNLGAGVLLGYSAAQIWGNTRAWAMIVTAAALANLLEALVAGTGYVSLGASTVLFAALGLIAAWTWRTRRRFAHNSMRRWAPLVAGVVVLALFGGGGGDADAAFAVQAVSDSHTNVLSHALGFITGALAGVAAATRPGARLLSIMPTWMAAAVAIGPLLLAWSIALLVR
jgi:membrane associated rhomboid family serine protease